VRPGVADPAGPPIRRRRMDGRRVPKETAHPAGEAEAVLGFGAVGETAWVDDQPTQHPFPAGGVFL
jgi:hypothetical protein